MFLSGKTTVAAEVFWQPVVSLPLLVILAPHLAKNRMSFLSVRAVLFLMKNLACVSTEADVICCPSYYQGIFRVPYFAKVGYRPLVPDADPCPTPQGYVDIGLPACLVERGSRGTIGYAERRSWTKRCMGVVKFSRYVTRSFVVAPDDKLNSVAYLGSVLLMRILYFRSRWGRGVLHGAMILGSYKTTARFRLLAEM